MCALDCKINFVITQMDLWPELYDPKYAGNIDEIPDEKLGSVEVCWIAQTYIKLKRRGFNVCLKNHFVAGEICVVSAGELFSHMDAVKRSYVVAIRGDCSRSFISHLSVNQNRYGSRFAHEHFIPHWPQPGILPRESLRGTQISCISFKGDQLPSGFKSNSFREKLLELGVVLVLEEKGRDGYNWRDYSKVDLVLAVRDFYGVTKPASKLVNAWLAEVPALLGAEPAFQEMKVDDLDYIEVSTEEEVLEAVACLIKNPSLYQKMRERCVERGREFSEDKFIDLWVSFIVNEVEVHYLAWEKYSHLRRTLIYYRNLVLQHLQWKKETAGVRLIPFFKKYRRSLEAIFLR